MDFYEIVTKVEKDGTLQIYPDWQVEKSSDLMVRGGYFYAFWDENQGLWSRDEFRLRTLIDVSLFLYAKENVDQGVPYKVMSTQSFSTGMWEKFIRFLKNYPDNAIDLDSSLTFANSVVTKDDHASKRLPYSLESAPTDAWDEICSTLYTEQERDKFEWAIGAVVSGDSRYLQKFVVFYGPPGSGKSTILNVIQDLFEGYTTTFDAQALAQSGSTFATDAFRENPLVAIQHDGDLSRIADNTKLNSITSHELMTMHEKYKPSRTARVNAFLFMGTNKPVQITDAKAGIIRRLIDIHPSGNSIPEERYHKLMQNVKFELGAIAQRCLDRYREMGKHYYSGYKPVQMMYQTDEFYNYVVANFDVFQEKDGITLRQAWALYKEYCEDVGITKLMRYSVFREELNMYFEEFHDRATVSGEAVRSYYSGFLGLPKSSDFVPDRTYLIEVEEATSPSVFDRVYSEQPAQLAGFHGNPVDAWDDVTTTLSAIDPHELHFVRVPEHHIVIDFDLVDEDGEKDLERNLEAASQWPPTYTELSQSGSGVHLHYIYAGDVRELAQVYDVGVEVKTLLGKSALRRRLTKCNTLDITTINSGLPLKEKPVLTKQSLSSEKALRSLIERNLRKEIHPGTKPSVEFIYDILEEVYEQGLAYNVTDMRSKILTFAARSSNQAPWCIKKVQEMKFEGKEMEESYDDIDVDEPLVFFDVEVYPNLFMVCWKYDGSDRVTRMINPSPEEIENLFKLRLVGFNNRRYDNHILYARYLGYNNERLFKLSDQIINTKDRHATFVEAYNISFADIYDFSSKKQGLKKFMIELGLNHMELDIPWDQPVPEELWPRVEEYCVNDVKGTEAVFHARHQDFVAREILSDLSGLPINHTTQNHTAKIIFEGNKTPQSLFVYTDLSKEFPGYEFDAGASTYRGEVTGEGGYVYSEPGSYSNVALLDIASMHPTSIVELNLFGRYTKNFKALMDARLAIKHGDFNLARSNDILGGKLAKFLVDAEDDPADAEALSYALKIVINIVYGLTSAKFSNPFKDPRNKDNIVAKRGALFMVELKHAIQERGGKVVHIKTDSVKVVDPTDELVEFIMEFGRKYGYTFEHEATYDKLCLVNDAVYIARSDSKWTAVGAQFQHPYVFKTLFSGESTTFEDFCETRNVVQGTMYLDFEGTDDISQMTHVGRTGSFVPVKDGGGVLYRVKDDQKYAVTGTKGHRWVDREIAQQREDHNELFVDMDYFEQLANEARAAIEEYQPFEDFVS